MAPVAISRPSGNDLWALAAAKLTDDDKRNINFSVPNKVDILADLHKVTESSRQECIKRRWRYIRKTGETVILRDLFDKVIKWIDLFKQMGDIAMQYSPAQAALPWAGVRFVLQIAVNDNAKFAFMIEGVASIAELICRSAIVQKYYTGSASEPGDELERSLIKLYSAIMLYLSKAKRYFDQNSAKRVFKGGLLAESDFDSYLSSIRAAQEDVDRCTALVDRHDQVCNHLELRRLLEQVEAPLRRMGGDLETLEDRLDRAKRSQILGWLSSEPYIKHHEQTKKDVLPGTGQWLLSDTVFRTWKNGSESSLLWLHGMIGSGKSKLVSIVIEEAMRTSRAGYNPPPAFFYCSRNAAERTRSDPEAILASLARQLSSMQPGDPLLSPAVELYREKEGQGFASGPLRIDESRELIVQLMEHYPLTLIIIDAFDECDPDKRADLLEALEAILRESSSLVKIFLSSRDDQDIVFQLKQYPNLEISSDRNGDDIAKFVKAETEKLIEKKKLLRYSQAREEMEELIVRKVAHGATGMFRWASLQLQHLFSLTLDVDIRNRLGRLPPTLETLYSELYATLSAGPAEFGNAVLRNVLSWLLCAQKTLDEAEFLAAVSIVPNKGYERVSKDQVLDICNNFVVFDQQMNTFRFAHLSVREFLEKRPEYTEAATNCLAAQICLLDLISITPNAAAKRFMFEYYQDLVGKPPSPEAFSWYSNVYWARHCQLAAEERTYGTLRDLFWFFLSNETDLTSPFAIWSSQIPGLLDGGVEWDLKQKLRDAQAKSASIVFLVGSFDFPEILETRQGAQTTLAKLTNSQGADILQVCTRCGSCKMMAHLLDQRGADIQITEEVVKAAARNRKMGKEVMTLLLDRRADIKITQGVVKAAAANWGTGKEVIALFLDRRGADIPITEEVVRAASWNEQCGREITMLLLDQRGVNIQAAEKVARAVAEKFDKDVMTLLLNQRGADIQVTEKVVEAVAGNKKDGKEMMILLLDRQGADVQITEDSVKLIAQNFDNEVMKLLLGRRGVEVQVTAGVLEAAAGNEKIGKEVMILLLDRRGADIQITEKFVKLIVQKFDKEVMRHLLDRRGAEVQVTAGVLEAAAGNQRNGKEVVMLLLDRPGADAKIEEEVVELIAQTFDSEIMNLLLDRRRSYVRVTEKIVKAAAENWKSGKEVMMLLLDRRGTDIRITEEVIKRVAGNLDCGKEVMTLLLDRRGADLQITEEVLKTVARNWKSGVGIMTLLLDRRGADIRITEEVLKEAAGDWDSGKAIMTLLLGRRGAEIQITEEVLKAAAGNGGHGQEVMTLLLDRRGTDIQITEEVLKAAAGNWKSGKEVMTLLLDRQGADVQITEEVVETAAENWRGEEMMTPLLNRREVDIRITEEVIKAAARHWGSGEAVMALLDRPGTDIQITEEVLKAAAGNHGSDKVIMTLLLGRRGADIQITEEILKAAAGNRGRGKEVMTLLLNQRGADIQITGGVLKAAAGNWSSGKEVMTLLLDRRGADIQITEEVLEAAVGNRGCGKEIMTLLRNRPGAGVQILGGSASSALNTPAEKLGLVGLSGRLKPLAGLVAQQACTVPIVERAKSQQ